MSERPDVRDPRPDMLNRAMRDKLANGKCLDVSKCPRNVSGDYILVEADGTVHLKFEEETDYADATTESWIWSIGRDRKSGAILASTTPKFYGPGSTMERDFECIFLR